MNTREHLLAWIDQFENDHYEFDMYGETVTVDLPRETVEKVLDIAILLVTRVIAAEGGLNSSEYRELEASVKNEHPEKGAFLLNVVMKAVTDDRLYGRYKDIEPMIGELNPRGYRVGSAAYLLTVRPELHELIYAVIRNVDIAKENCDSLAYTFFLGVLTKGWGEGFGWSRTEDGGWVWKRSKE